MAFPDGKREPDDLDDHYTSVRETREAGLDLDVYMKGQRTISLEPLI